MLPKRKLNKILKKNIRNIWLFRSITLIIGLIILFALYRMEVIAIAFINGQPISFTDIVKVYNSKDNENIIDKLIAEKLIEYEARKRNIQVKSEEISKEIALIEKDAIVNGITLAQLLKDSHKSSEDLEKEVRLRIIIYKILSENIELSEREIDNYVKENPELYKNLGEEETREKVRKLLIDAKVDEEYKTWIQEARASSDIRYFININ